MSVEHSPEHGVPYHLVCYDAKGQERPGEDGLASDQLLTDATARRPSDVFIFSHGWNADPSGAVNQYGRWVDEMAANASDRAPLDAKASGFHPLLAGLHWPSKAWADENLTGMSYSADDTSTVSHSDPGPDLVEELVTWYADTLADGPGGTEAIRTIIESAFRDAAPPVLPDNVREAYARLDSTLQLGQAGEGAAPGDDRDPFDPEETYQAALLMDVASPVSFGAFSLGGVLAPLRVLSFWTMKRRARVFGESGAAELLRRLQDAVPDGRFHLMGHSFGCIVASAAIAGGAGQPALARGVDSLALVQGAMSLWSFCDDIPVRPGQSGYFHRVVGESLVRGPVLVTTSIHDRAVGVFYPLGAGVRGQVAFENDTPVYGGIGAFGVRGPGIEMRDEDLIRVDHDYEMRPGVCYNLKADSVIATSAGISGAHSDICHPEVARAVWRAVESGLLCPGSVRHKREEPQPRRPCAVHAAWAVARSA
jgi:hypothetical protein